jgi:hypothetical protein
MLAQSVSSGQHIILIDYNEPRAEKAIHDLGVFASSDMLLQNAIERLSRHLRVSCGQESSQTATRGAWWGFEV